ncbi:MAG: XdhC family protein [Haliangiales bacterium]
MEILAHAVARARAGEALALVTVIGVRGSAPRHLGTKMLVTSDGGTVGTIGGGKVEQEVTRIGAEVAAGAPAQLLRTHLVRDLAMCCGGSMQFYIEPVAPSLDALEQALACRASRRPAALITHFDGRPKQVDTEIDPDRRQPAYQDHVAREPLWPRERVVLFGAGHVACAIGPLAASIGFEVAVCDDDETGALARIGAVDWTEHRVSSFDVRDVERTLGSFGLGDYVLIVTRDHAVDQDILERLLPNQDITYLGLIGSRSKIGRFRKRLAAKGVATPERWARLHAPLGLDIGAETPAEIAVAVVAQLIHVRRRGVHSALDFAPITADPPAAATGAPAPAVDSLGQQSETHARAAEGAGGAAGAEEAERA